MFFNPRDVCGNSDDILYNWSRATQCSVRLGFIPRIKDEATTLKVVSVS